MDGRWRVIAEDACSAVLSASFEFVCTLGGLLGCLAAMMGLAASNNMIYFTAGEQSTQKTYCAYAYSRDLCILRARVTWPCYCDIEKESLLPP